MASGAAAAAEADDDDIDISGNVELRARTGPPALISKTTLLSAGSSYFSAVLMGGWRESSEKTPSLFLDISEEALRLLMSVIDNYALLPFLSEREVIVLAPVVAQFDMEALGDKLNVTAHLKKVEKWYERLHQMSDRAGLMR